MLPTSALGKLSLLTQHLWHITSSVLSYLERSNTRPLFLWRAGCAGMAGTALQLRTVACSAKKCGQRHWSKKMVRDMGRDALLHPLLPCTSGIIVFFSGRMHLALSSINTYKKCRAFSSHVEEVMWTTWEDLQFGASGKWAVASVVFRDTGSCWAVWFLYPLSTFSNALGTAITPVCAVKSRKGWLFVISTEALLNGFSC